MKLDKIKFARLIAYLGTKMGVGLSEIEDIDNLIDIDIPEQPKLMANTHDINAMLQMMADGKKIEAIRYYRGLTGFGLKESKDMIELVTSKFVG